MELPYTLKRRFPQHGAPSADAGGCRRPALSGGPDSAAVAAGGGPSRSRRGIDMCAKLTCAAELPRSVQAHEARAWHRGYPNKGLRIHSANLHSMQAAARSAGAHLNDLG